MLDIILSDIWCKTYINDGVSYIQAIRMVFCKMGSSGLLALSLIWGLFCIFQTRYSTNSVNYNDIMKKAKSLENEVQDRFLHFPISKTIVEEWEKVK